MIMHRLGYWKREAVHAWRTADLSDARQRDAVIWANNSLQHSRDLMERCARLIELATRLGATREQINEIATRQTVTWPTATTPLEERLKWPPNDDIIIHDLDDDETPEDGTVTLEYGTVTDDAVHDA